MSNNPLVANKIVEISDKINALNAQKAAMDKTDSGELTYRPEYIADTNKTKAEIDAKIQSLGDELRSFIAANKPPSGGKRKSRRARKISNTRKQKRSKQRSKNVRNKMTLF